MIEIADSKSGPWLESARRGLRSCSSKVRHSASRRVGAGRRGRSRLQQTALTSSNELAKEFADGNHNLAQRRK